MNNRRKALLLMLFSTFCFSLMQLIVKLIGDGIPTMEKVFARNLVTLFVGVFMVLRGGPEDTFLGKPKNRPFLLLRSVLGFIGVAGYFYATAYMNVADASMLQRSSPFFVILLSSLFLHYALKRVYLTALGLAFIGAMLVIQPRFDMSVVPALVGFLSAAGAGGAYVVINYLKGKESNATIIFFFSLVSSLLSLITGGRNFVIPGKMQFFMLIGVGIFAGIGQIALTQAYKLSNPGGVSIMNYSGIIFSAILGFVFLNERISAKSYLGMALIFCAALLLYFKKDSSSADS